MNTGAHNTSPHDASQTDVVAVENLVKRYGSVLALDHFNMNIAPGEIFGLSERKRQNNCHQLHFAAFNV